MPVRSCGLQPLTRNPKCSWLPAVQHEMHKRGCITARCSGSRPQLVRSCASFTAQATTPKSKRLSHTSIDEQRFGEAALDSIGQFSDSSADQLYSILPKSDPVQLRIASQHQPQQEPLKLLLELDSQLAPVQRKQLLKGYLPCPQHYQAWHEKQHNIAVHGI